MDSNGFPTHLLIFLKSLQDDEEIDINSIYEPDIVATGITLKLETQPSLSVCDFVYYIIGSIRA